MIFAGLSLMGASEIFIKLTTFKGFSNFGSRLAANVCCRVVRPVSGIFYCNLLLFNGFCNRSQSPELPDWVKFPPDGNTCGVDSEDDFVLPKGDGGLKDRFGSWGTVDLGSNAKYEHAGIVDRDVNEISCVLRSRFQSPEAVIRALDACNVDVSEEFVDKILKRFVNDWVPAFGFFKWATLRKGYKSSAESYDTMVDILGKSKQFDIMWVLVEEMVQIAGLISLVTMSKIMRRLAGAGRWMTAIETFHDIEHFGLTKDASAMNILLDTLCKERSVEHARDAFLEMRGQIYPDSSTFNIMIHGWCKARKMDEAHRTMDEMRCYGYKPCVVSYTSLVQAYCMDRDFRKVDAILDEMQNEGCPPNVVTYTIVMHALGKAKETQEALDVFEKMKRSGCIPDTSVYNSLIYILGKADRLKDARDIYEEMLKSGISPNVTTYHTLISVACDHSQEETALELLQKMEENSCKPDLKIYTPLLKMCCKKKRMKVLIYLLSDMFKKDISLDFGTYTLLVIGLSRNGKLEQSCLFFEEMVLKGMLPWRNTYGTLIEELERKKMGKSRERIQQLMLQAESMKQSADHLHALDKLEAN